MCSLRTCQYALRQNCLRLDLLDCEDILLCCSGRIGLVFFGCWCWCWMVAAEVFQNFMKLSSCFCHRVWLQQRRLWGNWGFHSFWGTCRDTILCGVVFVGDLWRDKKEHLVLASRRKGELEKHKIQVGISTCCCAFGSNALGWLPSHLVRCAFCCLFLTSRHGIQNQFHDHWPILHLLQPKWRERNHHKALSNDFGSWTPRWPFSNSTSSSAAVSSLVALGQFFFPCRTRFFPLAASTSLDLENSLTLRMLIRFPLLCKWGWKLRWKPLKVPNSYSVPFYELEFGQKKVELMGKFVFNCSRLFSVTHKISPMRFLALSLVLSGFLLLQKFLNFDFILACSLLCRTQIYQCLLVFFTCFHVKVHWFFHWFSIITRNKPILFIFFVRNVLRTTAATKSVYMPV